MASLVLTAVGTYFGGPIGGMVGGMVGQQVDKVIFSSHSSHTQEGPRLNDLTVQTSSYGVAIPRVYGTLRLPGNVVWSSGLKETRQEASESTGGKGGGATVKTVTYSYTVSFAVVLSGREIHDVGQIWADGKLLRDGAGKLAVDGAVRIYTGQPGQQPDPVIEALEGQENVNAFQGRAYVVFEDLALGEYANRIPNMTFEVVGDATGDVALAIIVSDICRLSDLSAIDVSALDQRVAGYMIPGPVQSRRALEELAQIYHFDMVEQLEGLVFRPLGRPAVQMIADADVVTRGQGDTSGEKITRSRQHDLELPREIGMSFIDPARDYQTGHQRARRQTGASHMVKESSHALVLSASTAKAVSEVRLDLAWYGRERAQFTLPPRFADLSPGDVITLPVAGGDQEYMVQETELSPAGLVCQAVKFSARLLDRVAVADSGAVPPQTVPDLAETMLFALDMPAITAEEVISSVMFWAVAAGAGKWEGARLYLSRDGGDSYSPLGAHAHPAVTGVVENFLSDGPTTYWDTASEILVRLDRADHGLASSDKGSVLRGANLAWVAGEIVQFQNAEELLDGRFRLTHLLRGRRGTEHYVAGHGAGAPFVLLSPAAVAVAGLNLADVGRALKLKAVTLGGLLDDAPAVDLVFQARVLTPFAPVRATATRDGAGNITLFWTRRSRVGGDWQDHADVPLGERYEKYDIEILDAAIPVRTLTSEAPTCFYPATQQVSDFGAVQTSLTVRIMQLSDTVGRGQPLTVTL
ncbi:phage tail protein [Paremcibacter congregatus]|uniref:phage tail protein n=1 Tax=Paremcibacter congregatus TaxID=2043170 RepID=UPI003A94D484